MAPVPSTKQPLKLATVTKAQSAPGAKAPGGASWFDNLFGAVSRALAPVTLAHAAAPAPRAPAVMPNAGATPANASPLPRDTPPFASMAAEPDGSDVAEGQNPRNGGPSPALGTMPFAPLMQYLWPNYPAPGNVEQSRLPRGLLPPPNNPPPSRASNGLPENLADDAFDALDNDDAQQSSVSMRHAADVQAPPGWGPSASRAAPAWNSRSFDPDTGPAVLTGGFAPTMNPQVATGALLSLRADGRLPGASVRIANTLPPIYDRPGVQAPGNGRGYVSAPAAPGPRALTPAPVLLARGSRYMAYASELSRESEDGLAGGALVADAEPMGLQPFPNSPLAALTSQGVPSFVPVLSADSDEEPIPRAFLSPRLFSTGNAQGQGDSSTGGLKIERAPVWASVIGPARYS